jgi:hypothetical protein
MFFFSSTKSKNRSTEQVLPGGHEGMASLGSGGGGEMGWRMNIVQIIYMCVYKCKNDAC